MACGCSNGPHPILDRFDQRPLSKRRPTLLWGIRLRLLTLIGHQSIKGRRRQPAKVARGPNTESLPSLGLISSRNWMGCAEHGNSGKHEQAYGLLHRDAAVERHRVFSVTPR